VSAPVVPSTIDASASFRRLFDENFAYVCRSLRRLGIRPGDLEDVAQDVFVAIHRTLPEYDPTRPIRPWLFAFAHRFAANYHRLARHRASGGDPEQLAGAPAPDTILEEQAKRELVIRALQRLGEERRAVLIMHDLDGFSAVEIASVLAIPVNTVYSRLRLAREEMRRALAVLGVKEVR